MKINDYFIKNFLIPGKTRDNYIFTNCPKCFLQVVGEYCKTNNTDVKPCCVALSKVDNEIINNLFLKCNNELQKKLVSDEYILQLVLMEIYKNEPKFLEDYDKINKLNNELKLGNLSGVFGDYISENIQDFCKNVRPIELNFILRGIDNQYLQSAVNNYISTRNPYSVKVYADKDLCNYYDLAGNIIEPVHDYIGMDINQFITSADSTDESVI